jgi:RHS repeat-associated protein
MMNRSPMLNRAASIPISQFTGKERDAETGLDYFGARCLSAAQGRFISPDWSSRPEPVSYADLTDPQSLNLYGYVRNNPLRLTDPDGHGWFTKLGNWFTGGGWNEDEEANKIRAEAAARQVQEQRDWLIKNVTQSDFQIGDLRAASAKDIGNLYNQLNNAILAAQDGEIKYQASAFKRTGPGQMTLVEPELCTENTTLP